MKRIFYTLMAALVVAACDPIELGKKDNGDSKDDGLKITVRTGDAVDIGFTSAVLNFTMEVKGTGDLSALEAGICYDPVNEKPLIEDGFLVPAGRDKEGNPDLSGEYSLLVDGLSAGTVYHYRAYAILDSTVYYGAVRQFETSYIYVATSNVVDMGTSVNWAGWNLGAVGPEEYGDYFSWGEVTPKGYQANWDNYAFGGQKSLTRYVTNSEYGTVDGKTTLDLDDDAAHVILGGGWRIPTQAEKQELLQNCDITPYTYNDVAGWAFTSRKTQKTIFIPAGGYKYGYGSPAYIGEMTAFWSSTISENDNSCAYIATDRVAGSMLDGSGFGSDYFLNLNMDRAYALNIRPVTENDTETLKPMRISLVSSSDSAIVRKGNLLILYVYVQPKGADYGGISWQISDRSVLSRYNKVITYESKNSDSSDVYQAMETGTCVITVTTRNGNLSASYEITVTE